MRKIVFTCCKSKRGDTSPHLAYSKIIIFLLYQDKARFLSRFYFGWPIVRNLMAAANRPVELVWSYLKPSLKNQRTNGAARAVFTNLAQLRLVIQEQIKLLEQVEYFHTH